MERDDVAGLVIVLVENRQIVWEKAFGLADPETGTPMRPDAVFRVESLSKPVTAWGVMHLAEAGDIDLDVPLSSYLQSWHPPADAPAMTPRQLLSHTAGLGLGDFTERYPPTGTRPHLSEHIDRDFTMIADPGSHFAYSDTGFNVLELLIQDVSREDFAVFMAREIFVPLGMTQATYDPPQGALASRPLGHDLDGNPVAPYVYPGRGSGGLHATASDMARFAIAEMRGTDHGPLSSRAVAALHEPQTAVGGMYGIVAQGYALGHFTEQLSSGATAVWHGGQGHGWMSHLHIVPATGNAIVLLSNSQRAWPMFAGILDAWSADLNVDPVGMARLSWARPGALGAIAALVLTALLSAAFALSGATLERAWRVAIGMAGLGLIAAPLWAMSQTYLFIFSILPGLTPWLGGAAISAGAGLLLLAVSPHHWRATAS